MHLGGDAAEDDPSIRRAPRAEVDQVAIKVRVSATDVFYALAPASRFNRFGRALQPDNELPVLVTHAVVLSEERRSVGERPEKNVEGIGPLAMMLMNGSNQMLTLVMTGISNCDWQALHAATPQGRRLAPYPVV